MQDREQSRLCGHCLADRGWEDEFSRLTSCGQRQGGTVHWLDVCGGCSFPAGVRQSWEWSGPEWCAEMRSCGGSGPHRPLSASCVLWQPPGPRPHTCLVSPSCHHSWLLPLLQVKAAWGRALSLKTVMAP